jgi:hypothetical protein
MTGIMVGIIAKDIRSSRKKYPEKELFPLWDVYFFTFLPYFLVFLIKIIILGLNLRFQLSFLGMVQSYLLIYNLPINRIRDFIKYDDHIS